MSYAYSLPCVERLSLLTKTHTHSVITHLYEKCRRPFKMFMMWRLQRLWKYILILINMLWRLEICAAKWFIMDWAYSAVKMGQKISRPKEPCSLWTCAWGSSVLCSTTALSSVAWAEGTNGLRKENVLTCWSYASSLAQCGHYDRAVGHSAKTFVFKSWIGHRLHIAKTN